MIQLYKLNNTNYEMNGDFTLHPISAGLHLVLNGAWSADFQCPIDDAAAFIENDCVIKFDLPHFKDQLWVVTDPKSTDFDTIEFTAYPIFLWDAQKELIMRDCRPTNKKGQDALEYMLEGCNAPGKYQVRSNISKLSTAYYINKNFMEALNSSDENSFVNRWGGEAIFDNYTLHMNRWAGSDRGFVISATKNISGFTISEDNSDFCNVIIPVGYNGWTSNREVRDETRASRVLHKRFIQYDFIKWWEDASEEDYTNQDVTVCNTEAEMEDALTAAAQRDFENGSYVTKYSYDVDFVDLRGYDMYKEFKDLEYVWLGDRVDVKNLDARITTKQVVTEIEYDLVEDEITRLILGSSVENFFSQSSITTSTLKKIVDSGTNTVMANTIKGVIDLAETSLRAQKNVAKRADVRGIVYEDLMAGSSTFGALCIGTQGIQISKQRTADNTDWIWGTAINYESIIADYIITGTLSGKDGNFWFDLDDGSFELGEGLFHGTIQTAKDAKIGEKIYLDYDEESPASRSGVYLGDAESIRAAPYIEFRKYGMHKYFNLRTTSLNSAGVIKAWESQQQDGKYSTSVDIFVNDRGITVESSTDYGSTITLNSDKIVVIKDGNRNTGVTYSGSVSAVKTVNGLVTGVTP